LLWHKNIILLRTCKACVIDERTDIAPYNCPVAEPFPSELSKLAPTEFMTGIAPDVKTAMVMKATKVGGEWEGPMRTSVFAITSAKN
jgi:hypothetical protein